METFSAAGRQRLVTRSRGKLLALLVATLLALYLCWQVIATFLPAIILAATLAIVTHRAIDWLRRRWKRPSVVAAFGVIAVALAFLIPVGALTYFAAREISDTVADWQTEDAQRQWREFIDRSPRLQSLWEVASRSPDLRQVVPRILDRLRIGGATVMGAAVYVVMQGLLALFFVFFLYRDEETALASIRRLMPLDDRETDDVFDRINDTVHATIFGTVMVAMIQGALGGTMFAILGVPGAVLWGIVMGLLSIIPYLGSFVIWAPAALFLAMQGDMTKAVILAGWGLIAIGLIDNFLYPMLVGQRLKQHTAIALVAIVGGVAAFGGSGIVLGPVLVTITTHLLGVWRQRTSQYTSAE